ncbi:MAG: M15 family metallopeptidase [Akkermansia sp.]|nr:M15 family metallopeptidase [Akkermansia sp.]
MKTSIRLIQQHLGVNPDGIIGPQTLRAITTALGIREIPTWPTQAEVRRGDSIFGAPGREEELVNILPAYQLFYEGSPVRSIRVHHLIASHVQQALREVLEHYGVDEIRRLGLDQYGGSYNYRPTTTGNALSMHAWGVALDFAPRSNGLKMKSPRATLSHPDCVAWWEIWERHGATSLGRARNYDWMHLQFARLA